MRKVFTWAVVSAAVLTTSSLFAQVVDPGVRGPVRRGAAAVGGPGVDNRIERREQRRDVRRSDTNPRASAPARADSGVNARTANPDQWRYTYHNNQWWYYTPQKNWMYYNDNNWRAYDANTYVPRYTTGYRGDGRYNDNRTYRGNRAGNAGANLGAGIGSAVNGQPGANRGANVGKAIGDAVDAANNASGAPGARRAPIRDGDIAPVNPAPVNPAPADPNPAPAPANPLNPVPVAPLPHGQAVP